MSQSFSNECPAPISNRVGHVGGIESITLDGQRYFFGFDFSNDLVVSVLIEDIDIMAIFASQYMEQLDGSHEPSYWLELANESIEFSELAGDESSRVFSTTQLRQIAAQLERAVADGIAIPNFEISYHLRYLLAAASEWPESFTDAEATAALSRLGLDFNELGWDCIDTAIEFLNGSETLQPGSSHADAALVVQKYLRSIVSAAPGNWRTLFSSLAPK